MTRSARHTVIRLGMAAAMVAALISCGGGESDSSNRNRNQALEECLPGDPAETTTTIENDPCSSTPTTVYEEAGQKVTCDVTWDAAAKTLTVCGDAYGVGVIVTDESGAEQGSFKNSTRTVKVAIFDTTSKVRAEVYMSTEEYTAGSNSHPVEFDSAVSATKSFTYTTAPVDPLTEKDHMLRMSFGPKNQVSQMVVLNTPLTGTETVTMTVSARQNSAANGNGRLQATLRLWKDDVVVFEKSESLGASMDFTSLVASTKGSDTDIAGVQKVSLDLNGSSDEIWSGNYGPEVTYADVSVDDSHVLVNHEFSNEYEGWSAIDGFQPCMADGNGDTKPCITGIPAAPTTTVEETTTTVDETTTTVEEAPLTGEETTTTLSPSESLAATISVQEVPCAVSFVLSTRTVTLCESFDRIVGAAFNTDGKFTETIAATGSSFEIPQALLTGGGARFVRIAVGQKLNGLDVATFRGEGLLDLGDGEGDVSGTIYISPTGQEAINSGGFPDYMEVELRSDGKFDINEIDDNELAFVTLNGEVFAEYDRVSPPSSWDEGKPLAWRAYQADGFGLPRLVASGVLALGGSSEVDYVNPTFQLNSQTVELLEGEGPGEAGPQGDPCGDLLPYMITTPVTPSNTNMVTFTVATDCQSKDSMLGIVVVDYDEDGYPVFSQFKSTKYSARMVATTFLADGEYDVWWGDAELVGIHEYVVNGGGTGANCHHPELDIDGASKKATLRNCNPGAHRMRVYAEPLFWSPEDDGFRLPFVNNVVDLSMVKWEGFFEINLRIDDSFEPDFIACINACGDAYRSDEGVSASVDTSSFAGSGRVTTTGTCVRSDQPDGFTEYGAWGWTDVYRPAGNGAFIWETWLPIELDESPSTKQRSFHLPTNGQFVTVTGCETDGVDALDNWTSMYKSAIQAFEVTAPMPNRPSNDQFADAPAIGPNVGSVEFTNVSSTNEQGEMGIEYSNSKDAGQFHSVWFTYTPEESRRVSFRIDEYNFNAMMRVTTRNEDGSTSLLDEAEMWWEDRYFCECDSSDWETVSFSAKAGTTYYIQITNEDYEESVGSGTLLVNGGEGDTVKVQAGDVPYASPKNLINPFPTTTTTTVVTTTTVAPVGTDAPGTPTTVAQSTESQSYQAAKERGSTNDIVTVLAPVKDAPASIEARQDARTVEIPVADLYGTVSAAGASVNTARSLMITQKGQRPVRVHSSDKTVRVPVGTETSDLTVVATDTSGKTVTAPIVVKKTVTPLVRIGSDSSDGGNSVALYAGIGVLVLVLLGGGYVVMSRKKEDGAEA